MPPHKHNSIIAKAMDLIFCCPTPLQPERLQYLQWTYCALLCVPSLLTAKVLFWW